jgi:glycosyltransferase involved in cell wall biosynthesis
VWVQQHWGKRLHLERISRKIEEANLRSADLVVVVSEETKRELLRVGVPEHRILFYPNCVDPTVFDPARFDATKCQSIRAGLGLPGDADLFTFVGTFGWWHGADVLASAIRNLVETDLQWLSSRRIHFLFVGDGPATPRVREILGDILRGPLVTLAGIRPQADSPGILAASDVLVSPHVPNSDGSPFFGSPTKLFEYMAMARLIVASDLDQIGQVLRGWRPGQPLQAGGVSEAAVLVAPGSEESLVRGIRVAVEMDPESRRRMAEKARFYLMQAFTWEKNIEALLRVLEHSLTRSAPGGKRPADREAVA